MSETGATVPLVAPYLSRAGIYSGDPVRGGAPQWGGIATATNALLGRGNTLIPHSMVVQALSAGATKTLRFKIWPRYACRRRLWISTYRTKGTAAGCAVTFTDPSAGTSVYTFGTGSAGGHFVHQHVEDVATPAASETAVAPTWALAGSATGSPELLYVACFELPRPDLTLDANEYGIEIAKSNAGRMLYTTTGVGPGACATGIAAAETIAQRAGIFAFARDTGSALSTTSGVDADIFLAGAVPVCLGRKRYTTSTVTTLQVRAYCRAGATTEGTITITMTSGDSATLAITSGMAAAWLTGEIDVDCEDLSVADGRRSARYDKATIQWKRTAGANSIYLESLIFGNG